MGEVRSTLDSDPSLSTLKDNRPQRVLWLLSLLPYGKAISAKLVVMIGVAGSGPHSTPA